MVCYTTLVLSLIFKPAYTQVLNYGFIINGHPARYFGCSLLKFEKKTAANLIYTGCTTDYRQINELVILPFRSKLG